MTVSLMFTVALLYIALFFTTTMYNHIKGRKDLFISSAFVLFMYVVSHLGTTLWLSSLSLENVLPIHYLFYAAMTGTLALGLFVINRKKLRVIMTITISLLAFEALLGYAVHIDRNIAPLNGGLAPNASGSASWLLWDMRDFVSQFSTLTLVLAVTMNNIYQVSKDLLNTEAFVIWENVEKYLAKFKPSKHIERAKVFHEVAVQNLYEANNTERDKLITSIGIAMLNEAIKESCYEPTRNKPVGMFGRFVYWLRS